MSVLRLSSVFEPLELSHVSVKIVEPLELSHVSVKIVDCIGTTGTQPCLC